MIRYSLQFTTLYAVLNVILNINQCNGTLLNLTSEWKSIVDTSYRLSGRNIQFPCESTKSIYKEHGKYLPKNILISRVQFFKYDAFVTIPRYKTGVPFTLGRVNLKCKNCQPTIQPYPGWEHQQEDNCDAIQSAVDIFLDKEYRLWVLDDGVINGLVSPHRKCSPKVVVISVLTHEILKTIDLSAYVTSKSNLQYIVTENVLGDDYIYISDAQGRAIIMFNTEDSKGRRLILPPVISKACNQNSALYLSILMRADHKNYLYFTYSDSDKIYSVATETLHDDEENGIIEEVGDLPENSGIIFCGTDSLSSLVFRHKDGSEVFMWDANTSWKRNNWKRIQQGTSHRQVTHVTPGPWKLLWVLESNVHDFVANTCGSFGASSVIHPIGNDFDDKKLRVISNLLHLR